MHTSRFARLPTRRGRALLFLLAAPLIGIVAFPGAPASASTTHRLAFSAEVDVKDDDVGEDDWCYKVPFRDGAGLNHTGAQTIQIWDETSCDEVRISVKVTGQLMGDERICNVNLDVYLYEGHSGWPLTDLDGVTSWRGGMNFCMGVGGSLHWDVVRVDNTAEGAPDHGWVRNLTITHGV